MTNHDLRRIVLARGMVPVLPPPGPARPADEAEDCGAMEPERMTAAARVEQPAQRLG